LIIGRPIRKLGHIKGRESGSVMAERITTHKISTPRKIIYALIVTFLGLILLEIILRLAGLFPAERLFEKRTASSSWQENLFANFMGIHEPNPELLWKMKPNLIKSFVKTNSRGLTGPTVPYEKDTTKLRILVLGDSTPLGIGLKDWNDSFVWYIRTKLNSGNKSSDNRGGWKRTEFKGEVEIINASTAGYTSLQGLKYYEIEGHKYKPDIVLVYLGNNDASYNGYLSDSALMAQASQFIGLKKALNNFKLYRLLKSVLVPLKSDLASHEGQELQIRVSPESFRRNLLKLSELCRNDGAKLMLCTIPVPLAWPPGVEFKVFTTGRDTISGQLYMPEQQREMLTQKLALTIDWDNFEEGQASIDPWSLKVLKSAYTDTGDIKVMINHYHDLISQNGNDPQYTNNLGVLFWRNEDYDSALVYLRQAQNNLSTDPILLFNLGKTFCKLWNEDSANHYLRLARDLDFNSLRIKSEYNDIIREIAEQNDLYLADLGKWFTTGCRCIDLPDKLPPPILTTDQKPLAKPVQREDRDTDISGISFVDHCHPDYDGHIAIALYLAEEVAILVNSENQ
jgi:lysophospholipase L1-like esterase